MSGFSTGRRMKELGLGTSGSLPSDPGFELVLHGDQSLDSLSRLINKTATDADLEAAKALAAKNVAYDTLIKEIYGHATREYGQKIKADLERDRMAGQLWSAAAGAGGAAGLIALIDLLQSPKIEEKDANYR